MPDPGVEPEALNAGALGIIVVGGIVLILAAMFVVVEITGLVFQDAIVESTEITGYPVLEQTRADARDLLSDYAPVDANAGIYRIPIDSAMAIIVRRAAENE